VNSSRSPESFEIAIDVGAHVTALHYAAAPPTAGGTLVFAHGAGAGQHSHFIVAFAETMSAAGFDVVTFNFPYTEQKRRLPDRGPVLEGCYGVVVHATRARIGSAAHALFIGGKSMGGRIATQLAATDPSLPIAGLVLLGYPLHPPGKPDQRRDAHLPSVGRPMLVVQGSRDTFGRPEEFAAVVAAVGPTLTLHPIEGGDHSLKVTRGGTARQGEVYNEVRQTMGDWMRDVMRARGPSSGRSR